MTSAREQWPALFWFFDVMHQDYDAEFTDKDECLREAVADAPTTELQAAVREWHDAFDDAGDEQTAEIVRTFNSWWDADKLFGGCRQWADWVREHLERELATRT
jgi:hypothetical protein